MNKDMLKDTTSDTTLRKEFERFKIPIRFIGFDEDLVVDEDGMYLINLGDEIRRGTHWVGLWKEGKEKLYFDSFGFRPSKTILNIIGDKNLYWNNETIQHPDKGLCGLYQFVFSYYMKYYTHLQPPRRLQKFLDNFTTDKNKLLSNQRQIKSMYKRIFEKRPKEPCWEGYRLKKGTIPYSMGSCVVRK